MTATVNAPRRLGGRALLGARLAWLAAALAALGLVGAGTRGRYEQLLTPAPAANSAVGQLRPDEAAALTQSGLSMRAYAAYFTAAELLAVFVSVGVAGLLAWGRSDEWMALYVSLIFVFAATALPLAGALQPARPWMRGLLVLGRALFAGGLLPLFFVFPNGRFVPGWTRWLVAVWLGYTLIWPFFPSLQPPVGFGRGLTAGDAGIVLWILLWALVGMLAQMWRFRHSSALERQRTKWVVFGLGMFFACLVGAVATLTYLPFAPVGAAYVTARLAGPSLILFGLQACSLSIALSVLRYRLWDIDILVRRALVYTVLSSLLLVVYFSSGVVLQAVFRILTGNSQSPLVTVVSTLAIAALFGPLRGRVQGFIDRRFFRRKYDAARVLARFGASVRDDVDLDALSQRLASVVDTTLQPAHMTVWLKPAPRSAPAAAAEPMTGGRT